MSKRVPGLSVRVDGWGSRRMDEGRDAVDSRDSGPGTPGLYVMCDNRNVLMNKVGKRLIPCRRRSGLTHPPQPQRSVGFNWVPLSGTLPKTYDGRTISRHWNFSVQVSGL